jgi:hypothetical protein
MASKIEITTASDPLAEPVYVSLKKRAAWRVTVINPDTDEIQVVGPLIARSIHGARLQAAYSAVIPVENLDDYELLVEFLGFIRERNNG